MIFPDIHLCNTIHATCTAHDLCVAGAHVSNMCAQATSNSCGHSCVILQIIEEPHIDDQMCGTRGAQHACERVCLSCDSRAPKCTSASRVVHVRARLDGIGKNLLFLPGMGLDRTPQQHRAFTRHRWEPDDLRRVASSDPD